MGFSCEFSGNHWKKALRIPTYELEAMRSNTSHARLLTLHNFQTVNAHSTDLRWCGTCGGNTPGSARCFPLTRICSKGAEDLFSNCWSPLQSLSIIAKYWQKFDQNRSDCHQKGRSFEPGKKMGSLSHVPSNRPNRPSVLRTHVDPPIRAWLNTQGLWPRRAPRESMFILRYWTTKNNRQQQTPESM